jgi:low affinity Fe/Cu permease
MWAAFNHRFTQLAKATAHAAGKPVTFVAALTVIVGWALVGPVFGFSDTWQLVVNTGTTIVTFLMVFLIQNTQNRDTEAEQIKLNELIRAAKGARNSMIDLEDLDLEDLDRLHARFAALAKAARRAESKRNGSGGKGKSRKTARKEPG